MGYEEEPRVTKADITMDGNRMVETLKKAGLDPSRLNLKEVVGPGVDIEELQSRLRATGTPTAARWEVRITVTIVASPS